MAGSIGVTGSTGIVGGRVAALLAERGHPQRLIVREAARAPRFAGAEVRTASDYSAADEMRHALEGVTTLLLVPAREHPDRVGQHKTVVDAAVAAGVTRIVYISFLGASPTSVFTLGRQHWATEEHIRASGIGAFTFLRMSLYLDFIPSMVSPAGVIAGPADGGRVSALLRSDVAAAAVAVLTSAGHDGATYELTGREAFTLAEAAAEMSRTVGRRVVFRNETRDEAYASRAGYGAPAWEVEGWVSSYEAIAAGEFAAVSDGVRRLTGRDPVTLAEYVTAHPESLDHVRSG
jgi:NAD(P)H dehydrogenase (quinone)